MSFPNVANLLLAWNDQFTHLSLVFLSKISTVICVSVESIDWHLFFFRKGPLSFLFASRISIVICFSFENIDCHLFFFRKYRLGTIYFSQISIVLNRVAWSKKWFILMPAKVFITFPSLAGKSNRKNFSLLKKIDFLVFWWV